ncbi:MAG: 50S ribosomal protein L6 [Patescibacteria group bacterium]
MSRIGKQSILIPSGVTVAIKDGAVSVTGPKGILSRPVDPRVSVLVADNTVTVDVAKKEDKKERSLWGTYGAHIKNMVAGVTVGFKKQLEINGVGYKVALQGKDLKFEVGFSHSVIFSMPEGVQAKVEKNVITLESSDIELLGHTAASIRNIKKPEPYKGKGIKYTDEVIRRKAGKAATKSAA